MYWVTSALFLKVDIYSKSKLYICTYLYFSATEYLWK